VDRLVHRQALVVVDHQLGSLADRAADRADGIEVVRERAAAQLQLDAAEAATVPRSVGKLQQGDVVGTARWG
jgi:hypothetical protein